MIKKLVIAILMIILVVGVAISWFIISTYNQAKSIEKAKPQAPKLAAVVAGPSHSSPQPKTACSILNESLAKKALDSSKVVKGAQPASIINNTLRLTTCEYTAGTKKASLSLYQYPTKENAAASKAQVQTQELIVASNGSTTLKPRQAAADVKGTFVVVAAVTDSDAFDSQNSQLLLKSAMGALK